jgi:hypothetical protein
LIISHCYKNFLKPGTSLPIVEIPAFAATVIPKLRYNFVPANAIQASYLPIQFDFKNQASELEKLEYGLHSGP